MWRAVFLLICTPAWADSVVAMRDISAGAVIIRDDVALVDMEISNALTQVEAVLGATALADISAGRALTIGQIAAPVIVERNARVTLSFQTGALEIRTEGRALSEGGMGDIIEIMNLSSRTRLTGRVGANGIVLVTAGS